MRLRTPTAPLVVYLDDLQWADPASLILLESLLLDPMQHNLLFIGAYRNNEVTPGHPLRQSIATAENLDERFVTITLEPLQTKQVKLMLADAMDIEPENLDYLTTTVVRKTLGNPFFIKHFITNLYQKQLLCFNSTLQRWVLTDHTIDTESASDNVIDLMIDHLSRLPADIQSILLYGSYMGHRFMTAVLATVLALPESDVLTLLFKAERMGFIYDVSRRAFEQYDGPAGTVFAFLHDRIQESCEQLSTDKTAVAIHLEIGRALLHHHEAKAVLPDNIHTLSASEIPPGIFDIVSHLNAAVNQISDQEERLRLARCNIAAGKRAKSAAAFENAAEHFTTARTLFGDTLYTENYDLWLSIYNDLIEAQYASGQYDAVEVTAETIEAGAKQPVDKTAAFEILLSYFQGAGRFSEAIESGRNLLEELGYGFPDVYSISGDNVDSELDEFNRLVCSRPLSAPATWPVCEDPFVKAAQAILLGMSIPVWVTQATASSYLFFKLVNLTLRHGVTRSSPPGMALLAPVLCEEYDLFETGYQLGEAAVSLQLGSTDSYYTCSVELLFYCNLHYWHHPLIESKSLMFQTFHKGISAGSTQWASYALNHTCLRSLLSGSDLPSIKIEYDNLSIEQDRLRKVDASDFFDPPRQTVDNLLGLADDPLTLEGTWYKASVRIPKNIAERNTDAMSLAETFPLLLLIVFGDFDAALDLVRRDGGQMLVRRIQYQGRLAHLHVRARVPQESGPSHCRRTRIITKVTCRPGEMGRGLCSKLHNDARDHTGGIRPM